MGRRLRTAVYVIGKAGIGSPVLLEAGSEVPAEYADQVTAISAYLAADEQTTDDAATASSTPRGTSDQSDDTTGYSAQTVDQLRAELTRRDLPHSGTKGQLIARLEDDDEHSEAVPPADGDAGSDTSRDSDDQHDEDPGQQPES